MNQTPLWRADELAAGLDGRLQGAIPPISSVSIDTRTLQAGALFFAIKGEARDGHEFVAAALEKGAGAAVVDAAHAAAFGASARLVIVQDVLESLVRLGGLRRGQMRGRVIAVTGSVGKTSTKEMLRLVFSRFGAAHASVASYNNHWGVPLTLARMPRESDFGIFEIGMNHPFEILPLTAMVRPHSAIVTTVEPVHLAQFNSLSGIADAKGEIFSGLEPGGAALINADNPFAARLTAHAGASRAGRILRFGAAPDADFRLIDIALHADFSRVTARIFGEEIVYTLGAPGRHLAMNSLAVLGAARLAGLDLGEAAASLADFASVEGRGRRRRITNAQGTFTLIDESYNANPASMRAALSVLGTIDPDKDASTNLCGRRIAVLGDMLELGAEAAAMHAGLAPNIEKNGIDLVFACGPLMLSLWEALPNARRGAYAQNAEALAAPLLAALRSEDAVMVKGSFGSRMGRIVSALGG